MNNLKSSVCFLVTILMLVSNCIAQESNNTKALSDNDLYVNARIIGPPYRLEFSLTNQSIKDFTINRGVFKRYNAILALYEARLLGRQLIEIGIVDDATPVSKLLKPGEVFSQDINLTSYFPGLSSTLEECSVIVFWSVEIRPEGYSRGLRFGGQLVIDQK